MQIETFELQGPSPCSGTQWAGDQKGPAVWETMRLEGGRWEGDDTNRDVWRHRGGGNGRKTSIKHIGQQLDKGPSESEQQMSIAFGVTKITRPQASVSEIVSKDCRVVFDSDGSFLQHKKTGKWNPERQDSYLYNLDLWCQVPGKK